MRLSLSDKEYRVKILERCGKFEKKEKIKKSKIGLNENYPINCTFENFLEN